MHEYEFRLVVRHASSFLPLLESLGYPVETRFVYYVKPHFRFRNGTFETKRVESTHAVYHDGLWFKWVHSVERAYRSWSRDTCLAFLHNLGNFQDPVRAETRAFVAIDSHAQLYGFRKGPGDHRLVFEWEYGTFARPLARFDGAALLGALNRYRFVYDRMRAFPPPSSSFRSNETWTRRSVTCIATVPSNGACLVARKLDGTFGLVHSYGDRIKEKWEGYECVVRHGVTLGDGLVFAAERMEGGGEVYLLDVYRVRGHETAGWCRRGILTEFLPRLRDLAAAKGYFVQTYAASADALPESDPSIRVDGLVVHDVERDVIYKFKTTHSIDVVYYEGYFYLPNGRIESSTKGLEEGSVYELSVTDGSVIRKRPDRFKGNSISQLENIFKNGWNGPPIEPLPVTRKKNKRKS